MTKPVWLPLILACVAFAAQVRADGRLRTKHHSSAAKLLPKETIALALNDPLLLAPAKEAIESADTIAPLGPPEGATESGASEKVKYNETETTTLSPQTSTSGASKEPVSNQSEEENVPTMDEGPTVPALENNTFPTTMDDGSTTEPTLPSSSNHSTTLAPEGTTSYGSYGSYAGRPGTGDVLPEKEQTLEDFQKAAAAAVPVLTYEQAGDIAVSHTPELSSLPLPAIPYQAGISDGLHDAIEDKWLPPQDPQYLAIDEALRKAVHKIGHDEAELQDAADQNAVEEAGLAPPQF